MIEPQIYGAKSILVVGAHAFDAEVIAGPLAFVAASKGCKVTFLHLTMGEQGHRCLSTELYAAQKKERGEPLCRATWHRLADARPARRLPCQRRQDGDGGRRRSFAS